MDIKTNKDNEDYLTLLDAINVLGRVLFDTTLKNVKDEAENMYMGLFEYNNINNSNSINTCEIRKDSLVGQYLLNSRTIKNDDLNISFQKVKNAFTIAMFESNPLSLQILILFQNQVSGSKEDLMRKYDESVLDYILEHDDFDRHLEKKNETYQPGEYIVYEDGFYFKKVLVPSTKEK